jgi:Tfp pilus assembly protein PilO
MFKNVSKEKRDRIILTALGVLFVVAGMWSMLIRPVQSRISERRTQLQKAEDDLTKARRLAEQALKIEEELETSLQKLRNIESQMASGDLYSWIIRTMNPIQAGFTLDIPTYSPPGVGVAEVFPEFPYEAARFAFHGTGTYHEIGKFVADMENRFPFARIANMELVSNGKADPSERLTFKFEFVTLIKPSKEI